jgi:hypothetical protein
MTRLDAVGVTNERALTFHRLGRFPKPEKSAGDEKNAALEGIIGE